MQKALKISKDIDGGIIGWRNVKGSILCLLGSHKLNREKSADNSTISPNVRPSKGLESKGLFERLSRDR